MFGWGLGESGFVEQIGDFVMKVDGESFRGARKTHNPRQFAPELGFVLDEVESAGRACASNSDRGCRVVGRGGHSRFVASCPLCEPPKASIFNGRRMCNGEWHLGVRYQMETGLEPDSSPKPMRLAGHASPIC